MVLSVQVSNQVIQASAVHLLMPLVALNLQNQFSLPHLYSN
jgi:hypothetical protein